LVGKLVEPSAGTDPRKVTIGGPLGGRTGLLVGSIFYDKHSIVKDAFAGECDATRAEGLIKRVNETHIRYGRSNDSPRHRRF
jgi:tetrahydromethanopterin S-methyltransferase subunit H